VDWQMGRGGGRNEADLPTTKMKKKKNFMVEGIGVDIVEGGHSLV